MEFSSEGIYFRTAQVDSRLQWTVYTLALVDAHSYVLYYGTRQFTVIPKRVFQNSEQQQAFEQLLTQHVARIVRREN
ncbi:MAG: YcxB family protein [Planctomycetales bacterium]